MRMVKLQISLRFSHQFHMPSVLNSLTQVSISNIVPTVEVRVNMSLDCKALSASSLSPHPLWFHKK